MLVLIAQSRLCLLNWFPSRFSLCHCQWTFFLPTQHGTTELRNHCVRCISSCYINCKFIVILQIILSDNFPPISLHCERRLENNTFVITAIVTISQYLANENIITKLVFNSTRVEYMNPSKTGVTELKQLLLVKRPLEVSSLIIDIKIILNYYIFIFRKINQLSRML